MTREIFKLGFWPDYLKHVLMPRVDRAACRLFGHGRRLNIYQGGDDAVYAYCLRCREELVL